MSEDIEIINQNARIEKLKKFFSKNLKKLIALLILLLLFLFSYFIYQEYKKRQKAEIAEAYNIITLKEVTNENFDDTKKLIEIIKKKRSSLFSFIFIFYY